MATGLHWSSEECEEVSMGTMSEVVTSRPPTYEKKSSTPQATLHDKQRQTDTTQVSDKHKGTQLRDIKRLTWLAMHVYFWKMDRDDTWWGTDMVQIKHIGEHPIMFRKLIKVCRIQSICLVYFILNKAPSTALKSFWDCTLGKLLRLVLWAMASRWFSDLQGFFSWVWLCE